jgi:rubrerythrin
MLAKMEDNHLRTFSNMRAELSGKEIESPTFDPNDEAAIYLRSLADSKIFFKKEIDTSSLEEVFKAAIVAEKDSIAFYLGMKDLVPDYLGKEKLDEIIKEEMKHIRILNDKLIDLKG